ncbi:tRNA lysidine(34) synthetase TilS [Rubritalea tangerina]|uniref:tRNA(Ile)-lysidine synthase n=1 Tax=Rubritalea tangerina TaxID=430798 RepID=A0ABW4Z9I4_9BACT
MVERIQKLLARVDRRDRWLVGVSGGRDSIALMELLVRAGFSDLVVVHVNHQLRGGESDSDARFVEELAGRCGIPFYQEAVDVKGRMEAEKKGIELVAREVRHEVYARALVAYEAKGVLLGHHADDQAETVLYNLLRGSNGLKGIRFENIVNIDGVSMRLVRPLLEIRRSEIDDYIARYEIEYREDASNAEAFTARNRIRHEVMPLLVDIMQREVVPSINAAAEVSREQGDFLAKELEMDQLLDPQGRIFLPAFKELDFVLQQSVIFHYLKRHGVPDLSRDLVARCVALKDTDVGAKCNLPGGRWMRRKEQRLFIQE